MFGLITFASSTPNVNLSDFMPVEIATPDNISNATTGVKNAPKAIENPKPLADKIGEPKPAKELAPKVVDKPEIRTDAAAAAEPKPEPKALPKAAEKSEPKPEPKADAKPAEKAEKQKDKTKPDQIADELKKDDTKKPPKPEKKPPEFKPDQIAEQLKKDEAKKPPTKFDANQITALLDKREPQRQLATAETLNGRANLGTQTGHAAQLSQSELDALRARLSQCWSPPAGVDSNSKLYVTLHVLFKPDASLSQEPEVVEDSATSLGPALAESAKRALMSCQPFTMLKPEHYDLWKDIEIKFNNELLGG